MRIFFLFSYLLLIFSSRAYILNHTKYDKNLLLNSQVKQVHQVVYSTTTLKNSLSRVECIYLADKEQISCNKYENI